MHIETLLKLMEEKYGGLQKLFFYDDGSGAITASENFYNDRLFEFSNIKELVEHLKEKKEGEE